MNNIIEISERNQKSAIKIIKDLRLVETWASYGAIANLVGSVRMGLLMKNRDIDFHIYSDKFSILDSFGAIATIANNKGIKRVEYTNLLDTEEMCIEWHVCYQDNSDNQWQLDMIHILKESPYAGRFEVVADKINSALTDDYRYAILSIKNNIPDNEKIMGIKIYQAVIRDGIKNYSEFKKWEENNKQAGIINWIPG